MILMAMEKTRAGCKTPWPWLQLHLRMVLTWMVAVIFFTSPGSCQLSDNERTPKIVKQIVNINGLSNTIAVGSNGYYQIEVQGTQPLQYVWYQDGTVIQNDTSQLLSINSAQVSESGAYRCFIYNWLGAVRSQQMLISVIEPGIWPVDAPDVSVTADEGKFVVLTMPDISYVDTLGSFLIYWQKDGVDLLAISTDMYVTQDYKLAVMNLQTSSNGARFRVKLLHTLPTEYTTTYSHDFVLNVAATSQGSTLPPEFVIIPEDTEAVEGSDVKMECVVSGQPFNNVQLTWFKGDAANRIPLPSDDSHIIVSSNNRLLTIEGVTLGDAGVYGCEGKVNGQDATVEYTATLTVLVPPTISNRPADLITKDFQETLTLNCDASGSAPLDVQWFFNGVVLTDPSTTANSRYEISDNNTLTIPSVDLPDSGVYQCFVVNTVGETDSYTQLFVNSAPPTVIQAPSDKTVAEEEDTSFTCIVTGGPQPEIYWTKDGANLTVGGRIRITQQELLIGEAELGDSGLYTCHAVNIKGEVSVEARLTVVVKTKITKPPQNVSRILGSDAYMECGVRHDPTVTPVWTWYFTPSYLTVAQEIVEIPNSKDIFDDGTLALYSVIGLDSGTYECVVTSEGGDDRSKATLNVIELPSAPQITNVALIDDLPNSVRIDWAQNYDGHTPILKFIIQARLESSATGSATENAWETLNSNVDPALRSYVIENLLPSQYYRFRMMAVNEVNESEPSDPAPVEAIKMPAQPPSEPPKNLYCRPGGEREIIVSWDPPPTSSWNGDLEGYYVYYKVSSFGEEKHVEVNGAETRQTTIGFLAYNTQYQVNMAAYNEKGAGVRSSDFYVTTLEGVPVAPPENVALTSPNSTTIKVEWDPPDPILLNGRNQGYDIDVYTGGFLVRVEDVRFDDMNPTGRQTHYLTDLQKYTNYTIQIACKTAPGAGPESTPETIQTLEDVPGPVNNLQIAEIAEQSMFFTWEPPLEPNGVITGYEISYQKKDSTAEPTIEPVGPGERSHTLLGLTYNTVYNVYIRAQTNVGFGPAVGTEFNSAEPPQRPDPPTQLAATNFEARSVLLQFRPGFDGKATINMWIVEALVESSTEWVEIYRISDPLADEILVLNLQPYTYYQLRIIAENVFSKSDPSEPCNQFQTKQAVPGAAPEEVTPRGVSPTEIRVRWRQVAQSDWNGDYLGYKILYRRWSTDFNLNTTSEANLALVQEDTWTTVTLRNGSEIQEHTLSGLEEWMQYEVQMKAYNAVGEGEASTIESERTLEGVPSASPLNIDPHALEPTSIRVTWSPVPILQQNGNIMGYKVKYKAGDSDEEAKYEVIDGEDVMEATLTELRMFVEYDIQVLAFSRIGDGELSTPVTIRTLAGAPGPPVNIWFPEVTENAVTIMWDPPSEPNGVIRNYQVEWIRADQVDTGQQVSSVDKAPDGELKHSVSGLDGKTTYLFSVTAKTEQDWGEKATVEVYTIADRDRPDPPFNIRIGTSEILARSMNIYWSEGDINYGPIRNHTVQFRERDAADWETVDDIIGPGITSYLVEGLHPDTYYSFRVAATNDIGMSDFSQPSSEMQTLQDKPDGTPQNVEIVALTRTSIKISWEPPPEDTWNGYLLQDWVMFREEGAEEYREKVIPYGTFTDTKQGLVIDQIYEIKVASENKAGRGPSSVLQVFRVGDVAPFDPPQDLKAVNKSSTEIQVSWTAPPPESTNGDLIGYQVMFWHAVNDSCLEEGASIHQRSVTEREVVLDRLSPYTMYCTTVAALNIAGQGPSTLPKGAVTSEDLPGPPSELQFKNITLQELFVLWEAPQEPNGYIQRYQLQYFVSVDDQDFISTHSIAGSERQFYVTGLLENQQYTFQLSAITSIGRGNDLQAVVVTGPQPGSPEAPSQPFVERQDQYLYMKWVNGEQGDSPIYGYHIRYQEQRSRRRRQDSGDDWIPLMEFDSGVPEARINLNDLKPSTNYSFRVRAINDQGLSPPSPATRTYRTPQSLVTSSTKAFHTEWWFLVIVALTGVIFILLIITLLCYVEKRRNKGKELKRSATTTTVMSTPEPEDGGFPSLEMRQSRRSLARNGKNHNIYARSPPRPSPASVTYSEDIPPPPMAAAAAPPFKPPLSDNSSVLSEKPSNLGDSSEGESTDTDSSDNSIAKAPVPSSPPPPAFSSHFSRSAASNSSSGGHRSQRSNHHHQRRSHRERSSRVNNYDDDYVDYPAQSSFPQHPNSRSLRSKRSAFNPGVGAMGGPPHSNSSSGPTTPTAELGNGVAPSAAGGTTGAGNISVVSPPAWRFQKPSNAYTYTDSEAESSHYAFSLNNGNIVVNNVAGARTPLAGFSSFV